MNKEKIYIYENKDFEQTYDNHKFKSWFILLNKKYWTNTINYENLELYLNQVFKNIAYACYNQESDGKTNEHIHLYIELNNAVSFKSISKKFPGADISKRHGYPIDNREYIEKPEGIIFSGKEKEHILVKTIKEIGNFDLYKNIKSRNNIIDMCLNPEKKQITEEELNNYQYMNINNKIDFLIRNCDTLEECMNIDCGLSIKYKYGLKVSLLEKKKQKFIKEYCTVEKSDSGHDVITPNRRKYYLYGNIDTDKIGEILLSYGEQNVSVVDTSKAEPKFNDYKDTDILLMDNFKGKMPIWNLRGLLDMSYISQLPCRWRDKPNFASVIIVTSTTPYEQHYKEIQNEEYYKGLILRFNAGIWELYKTKKGAKYITCRTNLKEIAPNLRDIFYLNNPPILLERVKLVTPIEMDEIKNSDK